jgi:hypothetical protein
LKVKALPLLSTKKKKEEEEEEREMLGVPNFYQDMSTKMMWSLFIGYNQNN